MNDEYEEIEVRKENPILKMLKWGLSIILVLLLIWLIIWLVNGRYNNNNNNYGNGLDPLLNQIFLDNIDRMKDASKDYYTVERVPSKEGQTLKLTLQQMIDLKLLLPLTDKNGKTCDTTKSYTEITKIGSEYQLKINLSCGDEEEYIIVYMGCYNFCSTYICEKAEEKTPTPSKKVVVKEYNPNCSLKVMSGSKNSKGQYTSNVVIGFKSKTPGNDATIKNFGVGLKTNYVDGSYTVTKDGTATVYGYVKDTKGKTAICSIKVTKVTETITKGDPSCELKVTSGTLGINGSYVSNVIIGFKSKNPGVNTTLSGAGLGLTQNYTSSTYTVTEEGTTTVYGYVKNAEGKTATCNITITKELDPPTCSLKVANGTLNNNVYVSNVIIGFKSKTPGSNATITSSGIGLTTNYKNSTYTVTEEGTTTVYGYVKDSNGKTAVCSISVTKKLNPPTCSLKVVSGTLGTNNRYKSDVVIGFKSKTPGSNATITSSGVGLTTNYTNSTYTVTKNGTTKVYGYVKDSNGKTATCNISVVKDTQYEYLYKKNVAAVYSDWSDWSANKIYNPNNNNIVWGQQELIHNEKNGYTKKTSYQEDKNQPIWQVVYDNVIGTYKDYVCDGFTYYRTSSGTTYQTVSDWTYSHTLYNVSSVPEWTNTTKYVYKGINYAICGETCTSKPVYIVDVYVRTVAAKTETQAQLSAKCNVVVKDIKVYGSRSVLVGYVSNQKITYTYYYHTRTRTLISKAYVSEIWSDSANDLNLINQGYKYTGQSRQK